MIGFELRCLTAVADALDVASTAVICGGYRGRGSRSGALTVPMSRLRSTESPLSLSFALVKGVVVPIKSFRDLPEGGMHAISSKSETIEEICHLEYWPDHAKLHLRSAGFQSGGQGWPRAAKWAAASSAFPRYICVPAKESNNMESNACCFVLSVMYRSEIRSQATTHEDLRRWLMNGGDNRCFLTIFTSCQLL